MDACERFVICINVAGGYGYDTCLGEWVTGVVRCREVGL